MISVWTTICSPALTRRPVISDERRTGETDEVVGVHMIGPDAPEILQAAAIAVKAKLKKADFDATVALHPTMSEELVLMK